MIVQELQRMQHDRGYLSQNDLKLLSERLEVPLYRVNEVVSFYPHFRRQPPPQVRVQVCRDMSCHMAGACELRAALGKIADRFGEQQVHVESVSCLGRCDRAPAVMINERPYMARTARQLEDVVERCVDGHVPEPDFDIDHLAGQSQEWAIDVYRGDARYDAVREFVKSPEPRRVIEALEQAGLLGMGGAGGRAYKKWTDVWQAGGAQKYVVCNADESEPGTFKDRELLLRAPHLVLEGMILGGLVVGASKGYVYVRHEYPEQIAAVDQAIRAAERIGACGRSIFGSGHSFELETFTSPGGYICGEQTALIEAMEDKRAEPRNRPPELQTNGLWDCPTLLNNVETFAWVPSIVLKDQGRWFAEQGRESCRGMRFFSVSGDVRRPGVYEVPNGITFATLLHEYCGGMRDGVALKAAALSGPSGGFVPARIPTRYLGRRFVSQLPPGTEFVELNDLVLDIATFRNIGLMLGGGIVVYGEQRDLVDEALACLKFFRNESCGKCVPCRIGSQKIVQIATDLHERRYDEASFESQTALVNELTQTMQTTSICGLGMVAANPFYGLLRFFPDEVKRYVP